MANTEFILEYAIIFDLFYIPPRTDHHGGARSTGPSSFLYWESTWRKLVSPMQKSEFEKIMQEADPNKYRLH
jgi:hypothetical protein